jgi:hypothetical protein
MGAKGLMMDFSDSLWFPSWIPASAGMTQQVQQDAAGVWGVPSNSPFFFPQEWGTKGVEDQSFRVWLGNLPGFWRAQE